MGLAIKTDYSPSKLDRSDTQTKKKKTWNVVSKDLKTGEGGVATWQDKIIQTSAGPCKVASLVGVPIS